MKNILKSMTVDQFWFTVGAFTVGMFLGIMMIALTILPWGSKDEPQTEKTPAEVAISAIQSSPELFMNPDFISHALEDLGYKQVTTTVYNPVAAQCDETPLVTADNSWIDLDLLYRGELKWIAVSRDLLKSGFVSYGDRVELYCVSDSTINGIYEVHDTMNMRYTNYIDILVPTSQTLGKWSDVYIKRVED